jgi:tetratricopeptide (TPR) repeat protein
MASLLALALATGIAGALPAAAEVPALIPCNATREFSLPPQKIDLRLAIDSRVRWVELEESEQKVAWVTPEGAKTFDVPVPLRHGWRVLRADVAIGVLAIRRVEPSDAVGRVRIRTICNPDAADAARLQWAERAAAFAAKLTKPVAAESLPALLEESRQLQPPDARTRAFVAQLNAQALLINGRYAESASAFALAAQAWIAVGDHGRAFVAFAAQVEDEYRIGHFQRVLELVAAAARRRGDPYFHARIHNTGCLALSELGRVEASIRCYAQTVRTYERLDERSEYALALQTYAGAQMDSGRLDEAAETIRRGLKSVTGSDAPLNRGRLLLLAADLAVLRGDVSDAIDRMRAAITEFETAQVRRWQANAYLMMADLYTRLGAYADARNALSQAVQRLSPRDAPTRFASALRIAAAIEQASSHPELARWLIAAAEDRYAKLDMPLALDGVRLARMEMALDDGEADDAERRIPVIADMAASNVARWELLSLDLSLRRGRLDTAARQLNGVRKATLSLDERVRLAVLEARYWRARGDRVRALEVLADSARHIDALAAAARNPVLGWLIRRQAVSVRKDGVEDVLSASPPDMARQLFGWVLATSPAADTAAHSPYTAAATPIFDRAVARELLADTATERSSASQQAQHELLSILADRTAATSRHGVMSAEEGLRSLRRSLPTGAAFAAFIEGTHAAALLWVEPEGVEIFPLSDPATVRASARRMRDLMTSQDATMSALDASGEQLSRLLFGALSGRSPPQRLFVLDDGVFGGIAFAALPWPGHAQPLLDTTALSLVRLVPQQADAARAAPVARVFLAAQSEAAEARLPVLQAGRQELAHVSALLSGAGIHHFEHPAASVADVLAAFSEQRAWLHFAAHGTLGPGRIGYTGLWLDPPTADSPPAFVSWIDVLQHGVRSELVVLNACSLGDEADAGGPGFARAVAMAGAEQVVAGRWSLSDGATNVWVPAFYAALLDGDTKDVAGAVRAAQQELRRRRAFRHPFYWAGLQVMQRWPVLDPSHDEKAAHAPARQAGSDVVCRRCRQ